MVPLCSICHFFWFHYVTMCIHVYNGIPHKCSMWYNVPLYANHSDHHVLFFFEIRLIRPENRAISRLVKKVDSMNFTRVLSGGEDVKLQDRMDRRFWESGDLSIINIYQLVGRWWFGTNSYKL